MGASNFAVIYSGKDAADAFKNAVQEAQWQSGHGGYTGTIAEKHEFVVIPLPSGKNAADYARELMRDGDDRIDDKWGPAGCIALPGSRYLFFGWASS